MSNKNDAIELLRQLVEAWDEWIYDRERIDVAFEAARNFLKTTQTQLRAIHLCAPCTLTNLCDTCMVKCMVSWPHQPALGIEPSIVRCSDYRAFRLAHAASPISEKRSCSVQSKESEPRV
jgi:hypothetical protein